MRASFDQKLWSLKIVSLARNSLYLTPLVAPSWDLGAPAPGVHGYFFLALVKMTIGPLILSADMLDFISIISVR